MLHHIATISVCYGGHFESKMTAKIQNPPIWAKFGLQVDYDAANWYPNFTGMLSTMSSCADYFRNSQIGRRCHGNHKKTTKCLKCSELDETFQKFCLTCVHIILSLTNFRMAAVAKIKREKFKVLGIGWNLIEMVYGMCINGFEAWKFQNACRCHGNRKNTQFNTKVNNTLLRLRNFKMAAVAMEIIFWIYSINHFH